MSGFHWFVPVHTERYYKDRASIGIAAVRCHCYSYEIAWEFTGGSGAAIVAGEVV